MSVLSYGAGVNSTALLRLLVAEKKPIDEIIFADTGGEMPETYAYITKWVKPFLKELGIPFTIVVKGGRKETLEERRIRWRQVPSFKYRNCTRDFKILPIRRHIKKTYPELPITCLMGISFEELERMRSDHPPEYTYEYPLVDRKLTRRNCEEIIRKAGWPLPIKSGCFFCMYSNKEWLHMIWEEHTDHWKRMRFMEENGKRYPEVTLNIRGILIKDFEKAFAEQTSLLDFQDSICNNPGYCMT